MNLFCLGGGVIGSGLAMELIETFLIARFSGALYAIGAASRAPLDDGVGGSGRSDAEHPIPLLERDDVVIDGGNSYYQHDIPRAAELKPKSTT